MLAGIKDVDKEIVLNLDDISLAQYCKTGKYASEICKDDTFWLNKTLRRFGHILGDIDKIRKFKEKKGIDTWRNYYISLVNTIQIRYDDSENPKSGYEDDLLIAAEINKNTNELVAIYENMYALDTILFSLSEVSSMEAEKEEKKEMEISEELKEEWRKDLLDVNLAFFHILQIYDGNEEDKNMYLYPLLEFLLGEPRFKPESLIVAFDFDDGFELVLKNKGQGLPGKNLRKTMFVYILLNTDFLEKRRKNQLKTLLTYFLKKNELFKLMLYYMGNYKCNMKKEYLDMIIKRMKDLGVVRADFVDAYKKYSSSSLYTNGVKCLIKYF